jgi:thioesterase domain-containing protein
MNNLLTNITEEFRITHPLLINPSATFIIVHGADGSIASFYELAKLLNIRVAAIGYVPNIVDSCHTIEEFAAIYLQHLFQSFPNGPYIFAGHSFGGLIAYEMAGLLHAQSKEKVPVFLLDPNLPLAMRDYHAERLLELRVLAAIVISQPLIKRYDIYRCDEPQLLNLLSRCLNASRIEEILATRKHCLAALSRYVYRERTELHTHMIHANEKIDFNFTDQETKHITTGSKVGGNHFTMLHAQHVGDIADIINSNLGRYV